MFKTLALIGALLLTSCCSIPTTALKQSFHTIGKEYLDYIDKDPKYSTTDPSLSVEEVNLRRERQFIRRRNVEKTWELLNELDK